MKTKCLLTALLLSGIIGAAAATNDLAGALQRGLFEEEANHNFSAAIQAYREAVAQFDKDRQLAATAIFRLAECYRKQGNTNEANALYQRTLQEFADQTQLAGMARAQLGAGKAPTANNPPATTLGEMIAQDRERAQAVADTTAESEEVHRIQEMIKNSPDLINAKEGLTGSVPLARAAYNGQMTVARFLLESGAEVDARNGQGETPLHLAAREGHKAMVELLLAHKADVNARENHGNTPLHLAVEKGYRTVAEVLIAQGAAINSQRGDGNTPLRLAVNNGFKSLAEFLLSRHADVNLADVNGSTPLHSAAGANNEALTELLLAKGAEIGAANNIGATPLDDAAANGSIKSAAVLLAHGANPNLQHQHDDGAHLGWTPLLYAVEANQKEMVTLLLTNKANPNVRMANAGWTEGFTPLFLAIENARTDLAELLLNANADPNAAARDGSVALLRAMGKNGEARDSFAAALLAHGAAPDPRNTEGQTPLMLAASAVDTPTIRLLLEHKANPNLQDKGGRTALHYLAYRAGEHQDVTEAAELILAAQADVNLQDQSGYTPLKRYIEEAARHPAIFTVGSGSAAPLSYQWRANIPQPPPSAQSASTKGVDFGELLRQHGAIEDLPRQDRIEIRRPAIKYIATVFSRGTNDYNHFTLFDALAVDYGYVSSAPSLSHPQEEFWTQSWTLKNSLQFPDFEKVRIGHPTHNGLSWSYQNLNLAAILRSGNCTSNPVLDWGDIIEIPETDHPISATWQGFAPDLLRTLTNCEMRHVKITIKGETTEVPLELSISGGGTFLPTKKLPQFYLLPVLQNSGLVRASSDLSKVKVRRHDKSTGQVYELVLDCSDPNVPPPLWLQDGDEIEVPEKT